MNLMGAPPVNSRTARKLPYPDILSPPTGNIIIEIDTGDVALLPRLHERIRRRPHEGERSIASKERNLLAAVTSRIHEGFLALQRASSKGSGSSVKATRNFRLHAVPFVACVSAVNGVSDSPLCHQTGARSMADARDEKLAAEALTRFWNAYGGGVARVTRSGTRQDAVVLEVPYGANVGSNLHLSNEMKVSFSMDHPAEREFLMELEKVSRMPSELGPASGADSEQGPLFLVTVGIASTLEGVEREKWHAAHELLDRVIDSALNRLGEDHLGSRLVAHVLFNGRGEGGRGAEGVGHVVLQRLLSTDDDSAGNEDDDGVDDSGYSLEQIRNYQICLWTGIALVLVLFGAICCMVNMDVRPDSLLYAKFQADVSSKLE